MPAIRFAQSKRRFPARLTLSAAPAGFAGCVCESIEQRVLLSVTFGTPNVISLTGARAPLVAERFAGSSSPEDIAVATASSVQILTGSGSGTFTLGQSIALPANPCAESPFEVGEFSTSGNEDMVLDSSSGGDGLITYETNDGTGSGARVVGARQ